MAPSAIKKRPLWSREKTNWTLSVKHGTHWEESISEAETPGRWNSVFLSISKRNKEATQSPRGLEMCSRAAVVFAHLGAALESGFGSAV